ncbi:MAG: hypothetical protein HQM14_02255 [SAR324 cluster bacterium]|nr:hypothetical protein [SAR324 cluster bacterium]
MTRKTKYHILGPRNNWVISKTTIVTFGILLSAAFFFIIGFALYQYFHHEHAVTNLQKSYEKEAALTKKLEKSIGRLEKEVESFQKKLSEKKQILANLQTAEKVGTQQQIDSEEKTSKYLLQINDLQKTLKTKISLINSLKNQQKSNNQQILSLTSQIKELQQNLQKISSKDNNYNPAAAATEKPPLIIDQLQIAASEKMIFVQFNLKNVSKEVQSGYTSILPLSKEQQGKKIEFGKFRLFPFLIKRFRPFSKEFEKQIPPFVSIRIIVWDQEKNKLLDENYYIP